MQIPILVLRRATRKRREIIRLNGAGPAVDTAGDVALCAAHSSISFKRNAAGVRLFNWERGGHARDQMSC